jgi:hypothetical protein
MGERVDLTQLRERLARLGVHLDLDGASPTAADEAAAAATAGTGPDRGADGLRHRDRQVCTPCCGGRPAPRAGLPWSRGSQATTRIALAAASPLRRCPAPSTPKPHLRGRAAAGPPPRRAVRVVAPLHTPQDAADDPTWASFDRWLDAPRLGTSPLSLLAAAETPCESWLTVRHASCHAATPSPNTRISTCPKSPKFQGVCSSAPNQSLFITCIIPFRNKREVRDLLDRCNRVEAALTAPAARSARRRRSEGSSDDVSGDDGDRGGRRGGTGGDLGLDLRRQWEDTGATAAAGAWRQQQQQQQQRAPPGGRGSRAGPAAAEQAWARPAQPAAPWLGGGGGRWVRPYTAYLRSA